jgi:hypothetical protein
LIDKKEREKRERRKIRFQVTKRTRKNKKSLLRGGITPGGGPLGGPPGPGAIPGGPRGGPPACGGPLGGPEVEKQKKKENELKQKSKDIEKFNWLYLLVLVGLLVVLLEVVQLLKQLNFLIISIPRNIKIILTRRSSRWS